MEQGNLDVTIDIIGNNELRQSAQCDTSICIKSLEIFADNHSDSLEIF